MVRTDTHCHVWSVDSSLSSKRHYTPQEHAALDDLREEWSAHGIFRGVLVQPSFLNDGHSALEAALLSDPICLRGVVALDEPPTKAEIARLNALGVRGLRFNLVGGRDLQEWHMPSWEPALHYMRHCGWHIVLAASGHYLCAAIRQMQRYKLPLVVDHFGLSASGQQRDCAGIEALQSCNVASYVKLSAPYRAGADASEMVRQLNDAGFAHRYIWGSDWPFTRFPGMDMSKAVGTLDDLLRQKLVSSDVLEANAQHLYFSEHNIS